MRAALPETPIAESQIAFSPDLPLAEPHQQLVDALAPPDLTLRDRLRQSRAARTVLGLATATGLFTAATTMETAAANADEALVYTVQDTEVGVFARNSPHQNDTERTVGKGAYDGDRVDLLCGITNGDPVGPYNNHTWHKVKDLTNGQGPFWINDHWVDTPNVANQLAPGEKACGGYGDDYSQKPERPSQESDIPPTTLQGDCTGPFWGILQQDICVHADIGKGAPKNGHRWVGGVEASVPVDIPSKLEIWGDGFYHKTYGIKKSWDINKWVSIGTYICAAETDHHDVREIACVKIKEQKDATN